ncbi:MAG TPA: LysM peptidoglycan-binding domain-containing protein [Flavipsychrobacter sp.]|nr:LysM peptidoglycan-binding domain-containing protein [Flavipsychrobacter sp.]
MLKYLVLTAALFISLSAFAQKADSIFVINNNNNGWAINYKVKTKETVFDVARRFYVPPAMLADANGISFQQPLLPNAIIKIPLGAYNFLNAKPQTADAKPLYLKVANDGLYKIAKTSNVNQKTIQEWNGLMTNDVRRGQILLVGWVRFDPTNTNVATPPVKTIVKDNTRIRVEEDDPSNRRRRYTETIYIPLPDTTANPPDTLTEGEKQFFAQTQDGTVTVDEKGTAAFFKRAGKSPNNIFFAFHNVAKRGTIIKIHNPGADKTIYARVIGKLPVNGTFHNALIGISSDARAELGTISEKIWCEISYAP